MNYSELAKEGRRMWSEFMTYNVTHEAMWSWFDLNHDALLTAAERLAAAEQRCAELAAALERDRTTVCEAVNVLLKEIASRSWLMDEGRGSYEWDDDRYRQEFSEALQAIKQALEPLRRVAADLSGCPRTAEAVRQARETQAEHDADLIEKVRQAILAEADLGPDDRNTVVQTSDIEAALDKARKGEL